jgi:methionyl-tRNA formyltransferase
VPIKSVANHIGLHLHQIDTFKGWQPPESTNLVVAVSFGLLVPARILDGARYGGLNVHPSMLPDLRGPAPITHALLKRRTHTGGTLQTMHPTRFDHGVVLSQTSPPGIPIPEGSTPDDLIHTLGPLCAELLCRGIESSLFANPKDARASLDDPDQIDHAPKIISEDRKINWKTWTADELVLRDRVLGRLWDMKSYMRCFGSRHPKRVAFDGPWTAVNPETASVTGYGEDSPGQLVLVRHKDSKKPRLAFRTCDQRIIIPTAVTIDGQKKGTGEAFVNHLIR